MKNKILLALAMGMVSTSVQSAEKPTDLAMKLIGTTASAGMQLAKDQAVPIASVVLASLVKQAYDGDVKSPLVNETRDGNGEHSSSRTVGWKAFGASGTVKYPLEFSMPTTKSLPTFHAGFQELGDKQKKVGDERDKNRKLSAFTSLCLGKDFKFDARWKVENTYVVAGGGAFGGLIAFLLKTYAGKSS